MSVLVLGISAGFHDAAAAVVEGGVVLAAVEQERFSRRKHDPSFPSDAMAVCLAVAGREPRDVDLVVHHERPVAVLDRYLATRLRAGPTAPRSLLVDTPRVVRQQMGTAHRIVRWFADRGVRSPEIDYADHHLSHAAAAFFPSPFDDAAVLTIDGVGEWSTASRGQGHGSHLAVDDEMRFPHSLGMLYSAFTEYCGFRPDGGEGELMGLAPYGEPRFEEQILSEVVDVDEDGATHLNPQYFAFTRGRKMVTRRFEREFGGVPVRRGATPSQREADLAASVQSVLNLAIRRMARDLQQRTGASNLCLSGGVALNCVANGELLGDHGFERIWVQPAPGDAGSALGAALLTSYRRGASRKVPEPDGMRGSFLGPRFGSDEICARLDDLGVPYRRADPDELFELTAQKLERGAVVGWFRGRMEFGPRALGHRSILADARSSTVKERINAMVKERASFRPFAPAVLAEHASAWFDGPGDSPYMSFVRPLRPSRLLPATDGEEPAEIGARAVVARSVVPAVTHVDGSARFQTVDDLRNPEFARLLRSFHQLTGCPLLLNTSFNSRDEPIVCTPDDALRTFRRTGLDLLVLEDAVVEAG